MEIRYGNMFESNKPYLVNPVNTVGVMGKGLAAQFKRRYPDAMVDYYQRACAAGVLQVGVPVIWKNPLDFSRNVILFPTKKHWRNPSQLHYVTHGLQYYVDEMADCDAAFPLLGAGLGGLDPDTVLDVMVNYLDDTDCEIWVADTV